MDITLKSSRKDRSRSNGLRHRRVPPSFWPLATMTVLSRIGKREEWREKRWIRRLRRGRPLHSFLFTLPYTNPIRPKDFILAHAFATLTTSSAFGETSVFILTPAPYSLDKFLQYTDTGPYWREWREKSTEWRVHPAAEPPIRVWHLKSPSLTSCAYTGKHRKWRQVLRTESSLHTFLFTFFTCLTYITRVLLTT